jgi:hypothetical protein
MSFICKVFREDREARTHTGGLTLLGQDVVTSAVVNRWRQFYGDSVNIEITEDLGYLCHDR